MNTGLAPSRFVVPLYFSYTDAQIEVEVKMGDELWSATRPLNALEIVLEPSH